MNAGGCPPGSINQLAESAFSKRYTAQANSLMLDCTISAYRRGTCIANNRAVCVQSHYTTSIVSQTHYAHQSVTSGHRLPWTKTQKKANQHGARARFRWADSLLPALSIIGRNQNYSTTKIDKKKTALLSVDR